MMKSLIVLFSLLFAAVASAPLQAAGRFEGVTLIHMVQAGAAQRLAGYRTFAREFQAATGAQVLFVETPWEQMQDQMMSDFIGRAGSYDVFDVDEAWDANIRAYLQTLDPYVAGSGFDIDDYRGLNGLLGLDPGARRRYGIPLTGRSMVLFYRADVLAAAGIAPPRNWDELIAAARAVTTKKFHGIVAAGVNVQLNKYFFSAYKAGERRSLFSADGRPQFGGEEGARALDRLKQLFAYAPPGVFAMDIAEADQVFLNGEAAFLLEWPDYIQPNLDDPKKSRIVGKWAAMQPPGPGGYAGWHLAASGYSEHKDAAWAWIEFVTSARNAKRLMVEHGIYATRSSVLADPEVATRFPGIDAVRAAAAASFRPGFEGHPKGIGWFVQAGAIWSEALTGQMTSQQAARSAATLWSKLFDSMPGPANHDYSDIDALQ
ncbi:extracellular solute-binding protein [Peristeroidobacter soli]|uniref:extracellular solute-binding protein n=1 Tax=Peristeroidobacter soli TaxID=2497877 RepID=UPI00101B8585|nr:extracellular solute-binding protein [Peristeroidobacter soli]